MNITDVFGIIGGICFTVSGVPTAWQSIKNGETIGLPLLTQYTVFIGGICMYLYLLLKNGFDWIVTLDYAVTIISWAIIIYYQYFPRESTDSWDRLTKKEWEALNKAISEPPRYNKELAEALKRPSVFDIEPVVNNRRWAKDDIND